MSDYEIMSEYGDIYMGKTKKAHPLDRNDLVRVKKSNERARIAEYHGTNKWGLCEYYIEHCVPSIPGTYVEEHEIEVLEFIEVAEKIACPAESVTPPCHHPDKYLNVLSANLKFWVCPDCKKEL